MEKIQQRLLSHKRPDVQVFAHTYARVYAFLNMHTHLTLANESALIVV